MYQNEQSFKISNLVNKNIVFFRKNKKLANGEVLIRAEGVGVGGQKKNK